MSAPPAADDFEPLEPEMSSTGDLLGRARRGDRTAINELFSRNRPTLRRWARGRLPRWTRDLRDTDDLVQDTLAQTLQHIDSFEYRHEGAFQAYMRTALINRVRDEVRRMANRPPIGALLDGAHRVAQPPSPLEQAIGTQALARYEAALMRLRPEERNIIQARIEMQHSYREIAVAHGKASADAARMAVSRALMRLAEEMDRER